MAEVGTAFIQFGGDAFGSGVVGMSFSMENLPGLDGTGVISMNTMVNHLDPNSRSGPPEAAGFFIDWLGLGGASGEADPYFWGAISASKVTRIDFGMTLIQAGAKWTLVLELFK
jgi:hypothetical protein